MWEVKVQEISLVNTVRDKALTLPKDWLLTTLLFSERLGGVQIVFLQYSSGLIETILDAKAVKRRDRRYLSNPIFRERRLSVEHNGPADILLQERKQTKVLFRALQLSICRAEQENNKEALTSPTSFNIKQPVAKTAKERWLLKETIALETLSVLYMSSAHSDSSWSYVFDDHG